MFFSPLTGTINISSGSNWMFLSFYENCRSGFLTGSDQETCLQVKWMHPGQHNSVTSKYSKGAGGAHRPVASADSLLGSRICRIRHHNKLRMGPQPVVGALGSLHCCSFTEAAVKFLAFYKLRKMYAPALNRGRGFLWAGEGRKMVVGWQQHIAWFYSLFFFLQTTAVILHSYNKISTVY